MCNYEVRSPRFMIKTVRLYHVPTQSYSQNSHGSYILKLIIVFVRHKMISRIVPELSTTIVLMKLHVSLKQLCAGLQRFEGI